MSFGVCVVPNSTPPRLAMVTLLLHLAAHFRPGRTGEEDGEKSVKLFVVRRIGCHQQVVRGVAASGVSWVTTLTFQPRLPKENVPTWNCLPVFDNVPIWYQRIQLRALRQVPSTPCRLRVHTHSDSKGLTEGKCGRNRNACLAFSMAYEGEWARYGMGKWGVWGRVHGTREPQQGWYTSPRRWEMGLRPWFHPPVAVGAFIGHEGISEPSAHIFAVRSSYAAGSAAFAITANGWRTMAHAGQLRGEFWRSSAGMTWSAWKVVNPTLWKGPSWDS
jgi:hypothetical protein